MNERLAEVTSALTKNILEVVEKHEVTDSELLQAIDFLNEVGKQNEFHLLSDVLGVSVKVDNITHAKTVNEHVTPNNVEGPLYRPEAPKMKSPAKICSDKDEGEILFIHGQVKSDDGRPVPHALLDIWQANKDGEYENQDESQEDYNLRGRIIADENGKYEIQTVVPGGYDIGKDGPVGELMKAVGRHAWRPAHIHFKVSGDDFIPLTTMLFVPETPWLDSDAIGAVKDPLVMDFHRVNDMEECRKKGVDEPFYECHYDFTLQAASVYTES